MGYSILDLDEFMLNLLKQDNATMGVCVENVPVNVSFFSFWPQKLKVDCFFLSLHWSSG